MKTTKKLDLSASLEDYLEAIFNLARKTDIARSRDIAEKLDVSKSSVTGALRLLKKKGLINYRPYDYITLTDAGRKTAAQIVKKHEILKSFFVDVLGLKATLAQNCACRAEHVLGQEVINKLLMFIEFVTQENKNGNDLKDDFKNFCKCKVTNTTDKLKIKGR
jgi:DtxR family Mn-dependent transcriptional regulator